MKKSTCARMFIIPISSLALVLACGSATDGADEGAGGRRSSLAGGGSGTAGVRATDSAGIGGSVVAAFGGSGNAPAAGGSGGSIAGIGGGDSGEFGAGAGGAAAGGAPAGAAGKGGASSAGGGAGAAGRGGAGAGGSAGAGAAGAGTGSAGAGAAGASGSSSCPVNLEGWATVNDNGTNGTTGGGNVTATTVTTFAELKAAAQDSKPRVIIVKGTIKTTDGGGSAMAVTSNKTIIGADKNAKIFGGIVMSSVSNVIIRNLNIQGTWPNSGPDDTVASHGSHHIWYDHLNIWDSSDGSLDITNASNYQTVSWTKFWYTSSSHPHRLASLNGSGGGDHPEDSRNEKVTYHHNWWSTNVEERMPRVMYGKGHQYNNYFNSPGNLYCIGVGSFGSILVENNYFKDVQSPHLFMYLWHAYVAASGNVYDNTTGNKDVGMLGTRGTNDAALNAGVEDAAAFVPPYKYALDKAADIPALVQKCAGPQ